MKDKDKKSISEFERGYMACWNEIGKPTIQNLETRITELELELSLNKKWTTVKIEP